MPRDYLLWNNTRGDSNVSLQKRPHITNNANGTRYYSSVDAEIYFGNLYIDEVTSIEWAVQQQAMPIFGYNSYCFDDIAVGSRLIQGQFAVNFTKAGFLTSLQKDSEFTRVARKIYSEDPIKSSYFTDDFRKRLNLPAWDGGFDIVVGFGDHGQSKKISSLDNNEWKTFVVLDCCQITGSMVQLDYNGVPVQEVYTFIARDIKHHTATTEEIAPPSASTNPEVIRPELSILSVIEKYNNKQVSLRIRCLNEYKMQLAKMHFITPLTNPTLKNINFEMTTDASGDLLCILDVDKSKALIDEIKSTGLKNLSAKGTITYYVSKLDYSKGTTTNNQTFSFNINI